MTLKQKRNHYNVKLLRGFGVSIGSEGLVVDPNVQRVSVNSSERTPCTCDPCNPNISEDGNTKVILPDAGKCTLFGTSTSIIEDALAASKKIVDCTLENVSEFIEECINPIPTCIVSAAEALLRCEKNCANKLLTDPWNIPSCVGVCSVQHSLETASCLAKTISCTVVETTQKIQQCITKQGPVYDEPSQTGDIRVYESVGAAGKAIDYATCGYGYSHATLVCDGNMIHATGDGMIMTDTDYYGDRKFVTLRINLTDSQKNDLCECMRALLECNTDYDYLEAITFGTVDDPGKEICTMSIIHCLDNIGFDRTSIGLDGFVSPNELARVLGAPNSRDL